jgi:hypothetical protein
VTPDEVSPGLSSGLSPGFVTTSPNDFNDIQKGDTSTPVLPQTLHAHARTARVTRAGAHVNLGENEAEVSPGSKPLKPNGGMVSDTSVTTQAVTPPWTDWAAWRSRCAREPDAHLAWLAAAGGTVHDGVARLPKALEPGKARDWLEATLASVGLRITR